MSNINDIVIAVISGGVAVATTIYAPHVKRQITKKVDRPVDKMEVYFRGYEKLFKQLESEDEKKARIIDLLEQTNNHLEERIRTQQEEIEENKRIIAELRADLRQSNEQNKMLQKQLAAFKLEIGPTTFRSE